MSQIKHIISVLFAGISTISLSPHVKPSKSLSAKDIMAQAVNMTGNNLREIIGNKSITK